MRKTKVDTRAWKNPELFLTLLTTFTLVAVLLGAFIAVHFYSYFGDEGFHFDQIHLFLAGSMKMRQGVTTIPGYHLLLAGAAKLIHADSLNALRVISLCFSGLTILFFWLCAKALKSHAPLAKTLQFAFIPILFPFFPLVYTDVVSLLFVLAALYATVHRSYANAAIGAFLSVCIRQNNIVWFLFFFILFVDQEYRALLVQWILTAIRKGKKRTLAKKSTLSTLYVAVIVGLYAMGFALFGAFIKINGGLVIGDRTAHPFPPIHIGNIVFILFLA